MRQLRKSMGTLTTYLQREFAANTPPGWVSRHERPLLPDLLEALLGYQARADVLLENAAGTRRLWIEFEVSRADPVANHAKFATSHLFQPQLPGDYFVSMVSPHVTRGRRNLAANTIAVMRRVGMKAFQTVLLPRYSPEEIKRLNHLDLAALSAVGLPVLAEIERAIIVSEPTVSMSESDVHLVGDLLEVFLNLRQWNEDMKGTACKQLWGKRTVTYFVYDSGSKDFAPSKFCAYTLVTSSQDDTSASRPLAALTRMTVERYVAINDGTHELDGGRAQTHLTLRLGMLSRDQNAAVEINAAFQKWLVKHADSITVHSQGPLFLCAPEWFR